jgi:hypothetical protein
MPFSTHAWKRGLVLVGDAQQLADHRDRERVGQVVDDIDPVSACEAVDQLCNDPEQLGLHAWGRRSSDCPVQPIGADGLAGEEHSQGSAVARSRPTGPAG